MEKEVTRRMIELIGWPESQGDAIFTPGKNYCFNPLYTYKPALLIVLKFIITGGAIANLYAMNAARHHHFPRAKPLGMTSIPTLCAFTSEDVNFFKYFYFI